MTSSQNIHQLHYDNTTVSNDKNNSSNSSSMLLNYIRKQVKPKTDHWRAFFFSDDVLVAGHFLFLVWVSGAAEAAAAADDEPLGPALIKPLQQITNNLWSRINRVSRCSKERLTGKTTGFLSVGCPSYHSTYNVKALQENPVVWSSFVLDIVIIINPLQCY